MEFFISTIQCGLVHQIPLLYLLPRDAAGNRCPVQVQRNERAFGEFVLFTANDSAQFQSGIPVILHSGQGSSIAPHGTDLANFSGSILS